jgi:hypothetical protein
LLLAVLREAVPFPARAGARRGAVEIAGTGARLSAQEIASTLTAHRLPDTMSGNVPTEALSQSSAICKQMITPNAYSTEVQQ